MKLNLKVLTGGLLLGLTCMSAQAWAEDHKIAGGSSTAYVIHADGTLWAWGYNIYGQIGQGETTTSYFTSPVQVGSANDWVQVSAGGFHVLGLRSDGKIYAWGRNDYGQLGTDYPNDKDSPTQVGSATDWVFVQAGDRNSFAIKSNGDLYGWGTNGSGQIGNNSTDNVTSGPVQVGSGYSWVSVSTNAYHTLGRTADGKLYGWGLNTYGQVGDGTYYNTRLTPVQVGSATDWICVTTGEYDSLGIRANGTLWAWGKNTYGQLGDGTTNNAMTGPIAVGTSHDWIAVSADTQHHTVGITGDGDWYGWGWNAYGQVGDGSTDTYVTSPSAIFTDGPRGEIAGGTLFALGVDSNGEIWTWGADTYGALGNGSGDSSSHNTPQNIDDVR